MGKNLKIKHSVSSLPKRDLHGGTNFFGQMFLEMFYMGATSEGDTSEELMVKGLHGWIQVRS